MGLSCDATLWVWTADLGATYRCLDVAMDHLPLLGAAAQRLSQHALKRILSSDTLKARCSVLAWSMLYGCSTAVVDIPFDPLMMGCARAAGGVRSGSVARAGKVARCRPDCSIPKRGIFHE